MKELLYIDPFLSLKVGEDIYQVGGEISITLMMNDWEFLPEAIVQVEERELESGKVISGD